MPELFFNKVAGLIVKIMKFSKIYHEEPGLLPLTGKRINKSANTSNKARLDINARDLYASFPTKEFLNCML